MTTAPARFEVTWGDALVVAVFRCEGGLKNAVDRVRDAVGPSVGTRTTFAKLLKVADPAELDAVERFRAWLLLTSMGYRPADFGINDEAVPPAFEVGRLRDSLYTARDSNPEPADLASDLVRRPRRRWWPNLQPQLPVAA